MQSETAKSYLQDLLDQAGKQLGFDLSVANISVPEAKFGDYATNAAMVVAKKMGKNPAEVAGQIISELRKLDARQVFADIAAVGGFINFTLSPDQLIKNLQNIIDQRDLYGCSIEGRGQTVVFEYSSPNTNKPLHIGHTRNDVYGAACINLLKALGYKVISCEIINDRGIHIMKSVLMYQEHGAGKTPQSENMKPDHFVGKFYQMFATEAAKSPDAEKKIIGRSAKFAAKMGNRRHRSAKSLATNERLVF